MAFVAPSPGVTVLFGPSGSGKSTAIAALAGLLPAAVGRVAVDGVVLSDTASGVFVAPELRRAGVVFQDSRLFPHMDVAANLRFGMRRRREPGPALDEIAALLGIAPLLARRPHTLSGGERQRVAIGRALLSRPLLLLMDEPLASLDSARRAEIMPYLARLKTAMHLPILYVTHAADELAQLADHVVLLEAGRVAASGPVSELASRPDLALARRDDAGAVLDCVAGERASGLTRLDWGGVPLLVPTQALGPGQKVRVKIPAREVILARPEVAGMGALFSLHNLIPGTVGRVVLDASALVEVVTQAGALLSRVTEDAVERLGLRTGAPVVALVKSVSVEVFGLAA